MREVIRLWPDGAPDQPEQIYPESEFTLRDGPPHSGVRNVSEPTLTAYLPDPASATGCGVIVCPGGGHYLLAIDKEGTQVAGWLTERGIAAFVLKYRLIPSEGTDEQFLGFFGSGALGEQLRARLPAHWPRALADGQQAVREVRRRAGEWGLRPDRIGMMGFSAGGHVSAGVALADDPGARLDFVAPIYGALWQHVAVPADAPPMFTALAGDDPIAVRPCLDLYAAWHAAGRPAEIHIYARGGHGFGMNRQDLPSDGWIDRFGDWLADLGLRDS